VRLGAVALLLAAVSACGRSGDGGQVLPGAGPSSSAAAAVTRPRDRLAPGELEEGSELAFGLPLPRLLRVERRFDDAIHASGEVTPEALSNYVRERVVVAGVEIGAAKTLFQNARIKAPDGKLVTVEVVRGSGTTTSLVVRHQRPPARAPGASAADLWKQSGISPDGKNVDPAQNQ
jgi:hypothetical protein